MIKKLGFFTLLFVLLPFFAFSASLDVDYPDVGEVAIEDEATIGDAVEYVFAFAVFLGIVATIAMIIYGGFLYIVSVGNPEKTKKGKEKIAVAVLGLSVLVLFVLVIERINPELLTLELGTIEVEDPEDPEIPEIEDIEREDNLIVEENPLGHYLREKLNPQDNRVAVFSEMMGVKHITKKEREFNPTVRGVSGLNKYLHKVSDECSCDNVEGQCADTSSAGWCRAMGCYGDPCSSGDPVPRDEMDKIEDKNAEIIKTLLDHREKLIEEKNELRTNLRRFQELEQRMADCQPQGLTPLREQMERTDTFEGIDWGVTVKRHEEMGISKMGGNPLTFYCTVGGSLLEKGYYPREDIRRFPGILAEAMERERFACPFEYEVGEISDEVRELTIMQISKMEMLTEEIENLVDHMLEVGEYVTAIGAKACGSDCTCVFNPLYLLSFASVDPCFTCLGGCDGQASPYGGPAKSPEDDRDRGSIGLKVEYMKETEEEINLLISQINSHMTDISLALEERVAMEDGESVSPGFTAKEGESYLALESQGNQIKVMDDQLNLAEHDDPRHEDNLYEESGGEHRYGIGHVSRENAEIENLSLRTIEDKAWECYAPETERIDENWMLLDAQRAIGNYRHDHLLIENPNPRNLFCCGLPRATTWEERDSSIYYDSDYRSVPAENFEPLDWDAGEECIEGWACDERIAHSSMIVEAPSINSSRVLAVRQKVKESDKRYALTAIGGTQVDTLSSLDGALTSSNTEADTVETWFEVGYEEYALTEEFARETKSASDLTESSYAGDELVLFWDRQTSEEEYKEVYGGETIYYRFAASIDGSITRGETVEFEVPEPEPEPEPEDPIIPDPEPEPDVDDYNQYEDASNRLKQQLSCMRSELDNVQEDDNNPIGKISYISDHRIYYGTCSWVHGDIQPGGCSFDHGTSYGQTRISPHYGGRGCNELQKSFAVTFSDMENAEEIIRAAKSCNPSSYISYVTPRSFGEDKTTPQLQVSIAGNYNCGTN